MPLLDAISVDDLVRYRQQTGRRPEWAPPMEVLPEETTRASLRRALPYALLSLGLLAVVGLIAGLRAAIAAGGDLEPVEWLRLVMLGVASALVAGQGWVLAQRMEWGAALAARLDRLRPPPPQAWAPPLLDAVALGELRRRAAATLGIPSEEERRRHVTRRTVANTGWWTLVALALVLSAGIAALMLWLIAREFGDGRGGGLWLLLPGAALLVALLGGALTARTAVRSVHDWRQRRYGRLVLRVAGWVARGSPATGAGATASASGGATGGGRTGAGAPAPPAVTTRIGLATGAPGSPALGGLLLPAMSIVAPDAAAGPGGGAGASTAGAGGGSGPPPRSGDEPPDDPLDGSPSNGGLFGEGRLAGPWPPFVAAAVAAFLLGVLPWTGAAGAAEVGGESTPLPDPAFATPAATATSTPTPLAPGGGPGEDPASPTSTPAPTPTPPATPSATPSPAPTVPPVAPPPTPTAPIATPTPTSTPTPSPSPSPSPTPSPAPTPTPTPTPTLEATPTATPTPTQPPPLPTPTATPSPTPEVTPIPTPTPTAPPTPEPPDDNDRPPLLPIPEPPRGSPPASLR